MAYKKISQLGSAATPLAGTEVLPIVQGGVTVKVSAADITAGRAVSASSLTLDTALGVSSGGTGQTSYTNGQLLIGNTTGNTLTKATLTAGTNVSITNGAGSITINASDQFVGTVTSVGGTGTVNGITLTGTVTSAGDLTLGGTLSGVDLATQTTGTLSVSRGGTGATTLTGVVKGNGTSAFTAGTVALGSEVSGTLPVANGGTGQTSYTDGQLLIGNSTGNTLAKATLTAGSGIAITNGAGSVTIAATGGTGTVTSVDVSGGTTGLTTSGGPITGSGTITLAGTLGVANGGTGVTTSTGTGSVVLSNSPTLVTPVLGAASATSITNALGTVGAPSYTFTGDTNTGMWSPAADTIAFSEGGVESMRIDASGNVSIGTTAGYAGYGSGRGLTLSNQSSLIFQNASNTWDSTTAGGAVTYFSDNNLYLDAKDSASNVIFRVNGNTERMRINPSGNVGIGTNSPGQRLTVAGVIESTTGGVRFPDGTTQTTAAAGGASVVQYPQNSRSADYTLVLGDAGKQIFHPASDTAFRTYTIPANSSVAFPIGTVVLFTAENGAFPVNVAITSDTLVFGNGSTGTVLVPANQTLMAIKVTSTKWMANYLYQTGSPASQSIAVAHSTTPFVTAYPWSGSGFGTKFANPVTLPPNFCNSVAFSPAGDAIAVAHGTSPFVSAYLWSGAGFGTKFADPVTLPTGTGNGIAFNLAGDAIAVAHDTTPFISAYPWSRSGFGVKFANPATLPTGNAIAVAFSPAGDAIAVVHFTSPFITAYPWSGSGFGTKFADPTTVPATTGRGVAFSPAGDAVVMTSNSTPFIEAYAWSGSGFGTKFANPATLPAAFARGVAFSPAGDAIAVAHSTTPFVTAYPWSGSGFGTKFANPVTLPAGNGTGVAFTLAGDAIAVAHSTSPSVSAYPWSGSGFGTKFADPATLPVGNGTGVAFTINV